MMRTSSRVPLFRPLGLAVLLALTVPIWAGAPSRTGPPSSGAPSPGGPSPVIDPALEAAVASGGLVRAHVVLRGARPLVANPTDADERAFKNDVAAAQHELRGALPAHGVRILSQHTYAFG